MSSRADVLIRLMDPRGSYPYPNLTFALPDALYVGTKSAVYTAVRGLAFSSRQPEAPEHPGQLISPEPVQDRHTLVARA